MGHLLGKHLLGKGLLQKALGSKVGAKVAPKVSSVKHSSSSHSSHTSHHKKCKNVKKCWWKPVKKCRETFHESCWDEPREHCTEKKIKVAKKWCVEHEKEEENAFDKIKKLF